MSLDDVGQFDPLKWEIRINRKLAPNAAILALLHEWYHARRYVDNHLEQPSEEVELMCDTFAKDFLEVWGDAPQCWVDAWNRARDCWRSAKNARDAQPSAPSCSSSEDEK